MDIETFLDRDEQKDLLRFLTAGSVDDGKSTLIGRLLYDSKLLYEDQLAALKRDSRRVGSVGGKIDYALLLDGLKAEREQGITIDVAYRYFATARRKFIIADTPGHEQYTRNMVTGASTANLAVILVDATKGIVTQTRRHTFLVSLLGIRHVVLAVNKMDLVDFDRETFEKILADYRKFIARLRIPDLHAIPLSALEGDNVVEKSAKTPWYTGPALLELLETIYIASDRNLVDFRFPVQYILRPDADFRGYCGRVASGVIRPGAEIMVLPSGKMTRVKEIVTADGCLDYAFPPQSVTLTTTDEIDISHGDMLVHPDNQPRKGRHFEAMLVWMDETPLNLAKNFILKQTTNSVNLRFDKLRYKIDVNSLRKSDADNLSLNEIGRLVLTTARQIFFDPYQKNHQTGSFIIIDPLTNNTAAVGMIIDRLAADCLPSQITGRELPSSSRSQINVAERETRLGQQGRTIWITGLHASGKNEFAYALERKLFDAGRTVVVLDGAAVRRGLSRELDFSPADRAEHLRRVAETARILNDHGLIVIAVFISPTVDIRRQVKKIIGPERFFIVFVDTPINQCRENDQTGLYDMAEHGTIHNLPGIDCPYEVPQDPDFIVKTDIFPDALEKLSHLL